MDGLPRRAAVCRQFEHHSRREAARQAAVDRWRDGYERAARIDLSPGRCPRQGRQRLRAAGHPWSRPFQRRCLRRSPHARFLRPPPARGRAAGLDCSGGEERALARRAAGHRAARVVLPEGPGKGS